jgi:hypothetical protein
MNIYMRLEVLLHVFLTWTLDGVVSITLQPLYPREYRLRYTLEMKLESTLRRKVKFLSLQGIKY